MSQPRLSPQTIDRTTATTARPAYDRQGTKTGIVHLGIGAFHRAHMAVYVDDLLKDEPGWAIVGASLRRPDTKEALDPQDGLYTLAVRDADGVRPRIVGSIRAVLDATSDGEALLERMADPAIRIVSLTVTEKGYCHDPATGALDEAHPDIVHDRANPHAPRSAPGVLLEALARRRQAGEGGFAVLSCDNLPSNGRTVRRILTRLAALRDAGLAAWVEDHVSFPSTMVDRIVPATTNEDRAEIARRTGLEDAWPVMAEPFSQWVIEDDFVAGRPDFARAGAQFVSDVEPFEKMKLRMLNGAHSTLAYLGYLAGHQYVSDAVTAPGFGALVEALHGEVIPTLSVESTDLAAYSRDLLARFANPALKHRTWQIAMDGSQKLPQRLLDTIRDRIASGENFDALALGVAAWMRYVTGRDETGAPIEVRDPLSARLAGIAEAGKDPALLFEGLVGIEEIFGRDLARSDAFRAAVLPALETLFERGAAATVGARA